MKTPRITKARHLELVAIYTDRAAQTTGDMCAIYERFAAFHADLASKATA